MGDQLHKKQETQAENNIDVSKGLNNHSSNGKRRMREVTGRKDKSHSEWGWETKDDSTADSLWNFVTVDRNGVDERVIWLCWNRVLLVLDM